MSGSRPICELCSDTGVVRNHAGIDACPRCAEAAETTWRIISEQRTQRPRPELRLIDSEAA